MITKAIEYLSEHAQRLNHIEFCTINLSADSLGDMQFQQFLLNEFDQSNLDCEKICFEIKETAAVAHFTNATHFIKTLKSHGCRFALDDFGSGLTSFAFLEHMPVDFLKIGGIFVKDIDINPINLAMVRSINEIAQLMGKQTIAEHVENEKVLTHLRDLGVDYVQGYGIDHPQPLKNWSNFDIKSK